MPAKGGDVTFGVGAFCVFLRFLRFAICQNLAFANTMLLVLG